MKAFFLILAAMLPAGAASAEKFNSAYTTQDYQKCALVSSEDGNVKRRCTGYGGIAVNWFGADDDAIVDFGSKGSTGGQDGLSFAAARDTIEWRGPMRSTSVAAVVAIVRYSICKSIRGPCHDVLYVYRLNGRESSCVMAIVDGRAATANVEARRMADDFGTGFTCGRDKVRGT